jgi:hypothetical protein
MPLPASNEHIICIWYPAGGFGHFINALLQLHGTRFACPDHRLEFSDDGSSHSFPLTVPKYHHNPTHYSVPDLDRSLWHTVLIDNGINDESTIYRQFFPGSQTIKLCYTDRSWPIVSRTMIEKAMQLDFADEVFLDPACWDQEEPWAIREKYFLFLRDHPLRTKWRSDDTCVNLLIDDLLYYPVTLEKLSSFGVQDSPAFHRDWHRWAQANSAYIDPVITAAWIMQHVRDGVDLPQVDLWTQAVVNYYIWLEFSVEVPANDYSNWFTNTKQIVRMLDELGVTQEQNATHDL